ncbi:MAG: diguanylate cyclase [bacterium]
MVLDKNQLYKITGDSMVEQPFNQKKLFNQIKYFLALFLPVLVFVVGIPLLLIHQWDKNAKIIFEKDKIYDLEVQKERIAEDLHEISSFLTFLSKAAGFQKIFQATRPNALKEVAEDFRLFCLNNKHYDYLRYLDKGGRELIKINFKDGKAYIVPGYDLLDQSESSYFKDCLKLKKGRVYVSSLDLKTEKGNPEVPFKPIIRLGTPIFDRTGQKRGILILDYMGESFLKGLREAGKKRANQPAQPFMLLNNKGYWLLSPNKKDEWGGILKERKDRTFGNAFPASWVKIAKNDSGQFYDSRDSLVTFTTVYPLLETDKAKNFPDQKKRQIKKSGRFWKLVHFAPLGALKSTSRKSLGFLVIAVLLIPSVIGCWTVAVSREQIKYDAVHDSLTSMLNRRYFMRELALAISLAKRHKHPLTICLCDLDDFKLINDTYGHRIGDQVLITFSRIMKDSLRTSDIVGRYGGDEFCLIFPHCTADEARVPAENLRRRLFEKIFGEEDEDTSFSTTATFGIAELSSEHKDGKDLLKSADQGLYKAKELGRNRVVVCDSSSTVLGI